jgi:hypothetical protein
MEVGTLILHRSNGDEIYAIRSALLTASEEDGSIELVLYVDTESKPIQTLPDTADLNPHPNAEVCVSLETLDVSKLVGRSFSVPTSWSEEKEDHVSCLYYFEHGDLNRNVVQFLEQRGSKFLVHWTGTTGDVNHYDRSQPDTEVEIKAWFTFKDTRR